MAGDERLALLRELELADEAVAAELAEIDELSTGVEELRSRALDLTSLFATLPQERAAATAAVVEADRLLGEARAAAERAADELAGAESEGSEERLAEARRFDLRARDSLHMAERRAASARERTAKVEIQADDAERATADLEDQAGRLAEALLARPRLTGQAVADPGPGATGVVEWGTRARAALLVARSQLANERDAIVRQANELGAVFLGQMLPPLGAGAVARRVERERELS